MDGLFPGEPVDNQVRNKSAQQPVVQQNDGIFPGDPIEHTAPVKNTSEALYDPEKPAYGYTNVRAKIQELEALRKNGEANSLMDNIKLSTLKTLQTGRIINPILSMTDMETLKGQTLSLSKGFVRAVDGAKQFGLTTLEAAGLVPEGTTKEFTAVAMANRKQFEDAFKKEFGDDIGFDLVEIEGQLAPLLALRGGGLGKSAISQFLTKVASNTAAGSLGGALQFVEPDSVHGRLLNTVIGGILGFALTAAAESPTLAKQAFGSRIRQFMDTPYGKQGQNLDEVTGIETSLGMKSGDPVTLSLEKTAATSNKGAILALKEVNNRSKKVMQYFSRLKKTLDNGIPDSEDVAGKLDKSLDLFVKNARTVRRENWGSLTNQAKSLLNNSKDRIIDVDDATQIIKNHLDSLQNVGSNKHEIKFLQDTLSKWWKQGNALNIDEYNDWLTHVRAAQKSGTFVPESSTLSSKQAQIVAQDLEHSFLRSVDNVGGDVGKVLKQARSQWGIDSKPINEVKNSVFGKLFGTKNEPVAEAAMARINKLPDTQAKILVNVLKKTEGEETLKQMQALLIDNAMRDSLPAAKAANISGLDIGKLTTKLSEGPAKYISEIGPKEAKALNNGLSQLRRILQASQGEGGTPGQLSRVQELSRIAGNIPNPKAGMVFVSGVIGRLGFQRVIANALLTSEGRKAIMTISNAKATPATIVQAMNTLVNQIDDEE